MGEAAHATGAKAQPCSGPKGCSSRPGLLVLGVAAPCGRCAPISLLCPSSVLLLRTQAKVEICTVFYPSMPSLYKQARAEKNMIEAKAVQLQERERARTVACKAGGFDSPDLTWLHDQPIFCSAASAGQRSMQESCHTNCKSWPTGQLI
eukprot:1157532-Pelagomonas_calceolata.AAC.2